MELLTDQAKKENRIMHEDVMLHSVTGKAADRPAGGSYRAYGQTRQAVRGYHAAKQCFDFLFSLCVSIILIIPILVIMLIIMSKDFGNPFYIQKRIGKDGKEIFVWKFRSMVKGADNLEAMLTDEQLAEYKKEYKLKDDPRLLGYKKPGDGSKCFGAKLRRMSLDELPQILINICLKRDMSMIGPRPLLADELEKYYSEDEQKQITSIKPGLTGYWQAYARNDSTYGRGERQKMELHYIENMSPVLDMKILAQTVVSVVRKRGAV